MCCPNQCLAIERLLQPLTGIRRCAIAATSVVFNLAGTHPQFRNLRHRSRKASCTSAASVDNYLQPLGVWRPDDKRLKLLYQMGNRLAAVPDVPASLYALS